MLEFMLVIPATWEVETEISLELKSSRLAWTTWRNCLKEKGKGYVAVAQLIKCLANMYEALGLLPSPTST